jgi:hypothetical protein
MTDVTTTTPTTPTEVATSSEGDTSSQGSKSQPEAKATESTSFKPIKIKLKLDKEEREMEFDEPTLKMRLQKGLVADKRFEEAHRKEQDVQRIAKELKETYSKLSDKQARKIALEELGINPLQFAEELMLEYLEEEGMSDQDRKMRDLENFKAKREQEILQQQEEEQRQLEQQEQQQYYKEIDDTITQVLKTEGIDKNLETVERIIQYLRSAQRAGYDMSVPEIVEKLKEDGSNYYKSFVKSATPEKLAEMLGEEMLKKVNDYYLKKRTTNMPVTQVKILNNNSSRKSNHEDPYTFFKNLGR